MLDGGMIIEVNWILVTVFVTIPVTNKKIGVSCDTNELVLQEYNIFC